MDREHVPGSTTADESTRGWEPPRFEVISLSCEITSYAPDDEPLF